MANDEGLVEGDGGEPVEVAADEGVVERDGVEPAEVAADSDVAVPLFVQPSVSHWQLISAPSHWHVIPQRQRNQGRRAGGASDGDVQEGIGLGVSSSCYQPSPVLHPAAE